MRNRSYFIIESVNVSLTKIFLDLSGCVMYDTLEEAEGDLDVRGTEAVYMITESFTSDNNKLVSSTTIEKIVR